MFADMNRAAGAQAEGSIPASATDGDPQIRAVEFLLVPDASAARRVRRLLASDRARTGIVVGPWYDLLNRALRAYLIRDDREAAEDRFRKRLAGMSGAFWNDSLQAAPEETGATVRRALIDLVGATDPDLGIDEQAIARLDGRPRQVVGHLVELAGRLADSLPGDLGPIRRLLDAPIAAALHPIRVNVTENSIPLTVWQRALVTKLNRDANAMGVPATPGLESLAQRGLARRVRARPGSSLEVLQSHLFEHESTPTAVDETVQCIGVRDFYQEAETAAGMVQNMLAADESLKPADIGLLVPDDFGYTIAVEDAFGLAGLSLSGQLSERWRRDLGSEVVFHFLFCRQKPAPAMALAACLTSPLMPWTTGDGAALAKRVMDGRYDLRPPAEAGPQSIEMIDLIRSGDSKPSDLAEALRRFVDLLAAEDEFELHRARASEAAQRASEVLAEASETDWPTVRRATTPRYIATGDRPRFSIEGITVLRDQHIPWRDVRHLFVLGFHHGHHPRESRMSPVFPLDELHAIEEELGIDLTSGGEDTQFRRDLFRRQLQAASDSVTFLMSHRDAEGGVQTPSTSLVFIKRLFSKDGNGRHLVLELDAAADRAQMHHLAMAPPAKAREPREFRSEPLCLEMDLFGLRSDRDGRPRPESPGSLEMLLVSPLAWLLRRIGAEPILWSPERPSPNVLGSLVHGMFERMFRPGHVLPARHEVRTVANRVLDEVTVQQAPFMRSPQWRVERLHLAEQAALAAETWRDALDQIGAEMIAGEQWLEGVWSEIAVHGQADLILKLDEDSLLIVDYKWSTADRRVERMSTGYDTQAEIYRAMAKTGGPKRDPYGQMRPESRKLAEMLQRARRIGIVYFTMRDCAFLADRELPGHTLRGWQCVADDVAGSATSMLEVRIPDVQAGVVEMNRTTDRETFDKMGVPTHALEASPLVELFSRPRQSKGSPA